MAGIRRNVVAAALCASVGMSGSMAWGNLVSFPGAQGFGDQTSGARAAPSIYVVTNLNDSGAGSFRDAVSASNRIIVFAVSGYVDLQSAVSAKGNLTILGQTAPGQGFGTMGAEVSFTNSSNDILQYFKTREGSIDPNFKDSLNLGNSTNMMLDHMSIEFAQYDNVDDVYSKTGGSGVYENIATTFQNSIIGDPIPGQQFNVHQEGSSVTYLNNIWANSHNRSALAKGDTQFVNNVVYDYAAGYTTGNSSGTYKYDLINNYFIAGPSTTSAGDAFYQLDSNQSAYSSGNLLDGNKDGLLNGSSVTPGGVTTLTSYYSPETALLPTLSATAAVAFDTAHAGDVFTSNGTLTRDQVDAQVVSQVLSNGTTGSILGSEADDGLPNGGFGNLGNATVGANTLDTVPFAWLTAHGLSTTNAAQLLLKNPLGYLMIEQYAQEVQDQYVTQVWGNASGEWSNGAWGGAGAVPGIYDHAAIQGTGTADAAITISGTDAANAFSVAVGGNGPAGGAGESLTISGGSLTVQDTIYLGALNNATMTMTGGTVRANNVQLGNTTYNANGTATSYLGTLTLSGGTLDVGQIVYGAGTPGTYTSGGTFSWSGGTLEANGNLTVTVAVTLSGTAAALNTVGPDGVTYAATMSGVISGTGMLTKVGAGVLTLSANNSYSGNTTISGGAILAASNTALGTGTIFDNAPGGLQLNGGVKLLNNIVAAPGANEFEDVPTAGASATIAGAVSVTGSSNQYRVGVSGTGATLTLTGPNTTSGITLITRGNIVFAGTGSLINTNQAVTIGRSSATATASLTVQDTALVQGNGIAIGGLNGTSDDLTTTVSLAGSGTLSAGTGTINVNNSDTGGTTTLNLSGTATLKGGSFSSTGNNQGLSTLFLNGGTIVATAGDASASAPFMPVLGTTANPAVVKISGGGVTVNDGGFGITIAQVLSNGNNGLDGGVTKTGAGTLTLTGANTYTGTTTVQSGGLFVNNASGSGTGTGAVKLNAGTLGGNGKISGAVSVGTGAQTIAPGLAGLAGTLTIGGLTTATSTTLALDLGSPGVAGSSDLLAVTGNVSLNGGTVAIASQGFAGTAASLGYYKVLSYGGTLAGSTKGIVLPAVANNLEYTLDTTHNAGFVDVHLGYIGDANDDGTVDTNDLTLVLGNLGVATASWSAGNFDGAATVDLSDLNAVLNNLGSSIGSAAVRTTVTATPEPASLGVMLGVLPVLLRRRRRGD
jgi:autotransporter-associated beta strand protein